ncbi:MAG: BatD family protein [Crocinitomicaceae bacterium]|nr:BatD family protein [Crocinitomicaceae bacterium]
MTKHILSILVPFILSSVSAQTPEVTLIISPTDTEIGEVLTLTVKSNVQGKVEIDNLPGSFGYGYNIASRMETEMDHTTGNITTYYFSSRTGTFGKSGKYKIGPAWIKNGNKTYKSNTVIVNVGKKVPMSIGGVSAQQLKQPAFGSIQMNETSIYEGQSIVTSAKIYSKFEPTFLDGYLAYSSNGTMETHDLGGTNNIKVVQERFKGNEYFTFEYDRKLVFPSGTGQIRIDPYRMRLHQGYKNFELTSSASIIKVHPLPPNPPEDFIGGVGNFNVTREVDTSKIKQGDVFKLFLTIEGVGNLHNTLKPNLNLPKGFIVYGDPTVTENVTFNSRGAEGSILYEYNIQVSTHGSINLPGTTISYFDPTSAKYIQVASEDHPLEIEKDKAYIAIEEAAEIKSTTPEEIVSRTQPKMSQQIISNNSIYGSPLFWSGVSAPIACAFLFIFYLKRRERDAEHIEQKQVIRKKDKQLGEYVDNCKTLLHSEKSDEFFSGVEAALRKAFEVNMKVKQDRIISKQEIISHLKSSGKIDLLSDVNELFKTCEESRFSFATNDTSKDQVFNQLTNVLNRIDV